MDPSYVYFIQHSTDGPIKIGRSRNPACRRDELQCGNPFPLRLLLIVEASKSLEYELHVRFAHLRISDTPIRRSGGVPYRRDRSVGSEWHRPEADLLQFIEVLRRREGPR